MGLWQETELLNLKNLWPRFGSTICGYHKDPTIDFRERVQNREKDSWRYIYMWEEVRKNLEETNLGADCRLLGCLGREGGGL